MDPDRKAYDPEDRGERRGKAIAYLVAGIVVAAILYLLGTGRVEIFG